MSGIACQQIRTWAECLVEKNVFIPPTDSMFYLHVAQCDICRGSLVLLAAVRPELFPVAESMDCDTCQEHIPTFIDYEEEQPGLGIQVYPGVWWHLLSCFECAQDYVQTRAVVEEGVPELFSFAPAHLPLKATKILYQVPFPRDFLHSALPTAQEMRVYRGKQDEEHVIFDENVAADHKVVLSLQQQTPSTWSAKVMITPPIEGSVTLTLGSAIYQAGLSSQGITTISDISSALLLASDGPDLEMRIEYLTG